MSPVEKLLLSIRIEVSPMTAKGLGQSRFCLGVAARLFFFLILTRLCPIQKKQHKPIWCLLLTQSQLEFDKKLIGFQCHSHAARHQILQVNIVLRGAVLVRALWGRGDVDQQVCSVLFFLVCVHTLEKPANGKGGRNSGQWEEAGGGTAAWAYHCLFPFSCHQLVNLVVGHFPIFLWNLDNWNN